VYGSENKALFDETREAFKHSIVYGGGAVLRNAVALLLLPLYATFLTKAEFGVLGLLEATARILIVVLQMGMGSAYILAAMHEETADRQTTVSTAFSFLTISSLIVAAVLVLLSRPLSAVLLGKAEYQALLTLILASVFFQTLRTVPLAKLRVEKRSKLYSVLVALTGVLLGMFCVAALALLRKGLVGAVAANALAAAVTGALCVATMKKDLVRRFSKACLKTMLKFGLPLVPAALAGTALMAADRYFIQHYRTLDEVGLYELGYRFGMVMGLAVAAVQMAWPPVMYAAAKRDNAREFYALFLTYFFFGLCFVGLGLVLFSPDIIHAMGWGGAARVVPWIVASYVFWGIQAVTNVGVSLKKKTHHLAIVTVAAAVFNLLLNRLLIPTHGITGAAAATLISYGIIGLGGAAVSLRLYPIRYEYGRFLKIAVVTVLLSLVTFPVARLGSVGVGIGIKAICFLAFPLILYVVRFYRPDELAYVRHSLSLIVSSRKGDGADNG
jgi:O-antigen/teichoic acid export membrane protein